MKEHIGFFEESENVRSATRLIFIIGSIVNILMQVGMIFYIKTDPIISATYFSMIEGVLVTLKLYQNSQEKASTPKPIDEDANIDKEVLKYK